MFDESDRLRQDKHLQRLLAHYAEAGTTDREGWQDRLMVLGGLEAPRLVKLHGELIAYGWIEPNIGTVRIYSPDGVAQCYRATAAGHRALRNVRLAENDQVEAGAAQE